MTHSPMRFAIADRSCSSLWLALFTILIFVVPPVFGTVPDDPESASPAIEPSEIGSESTASASNGEAAATESPADPSVRVTGAVWRTKPGIVFLRTPIGLLSLSSKTGLRDIRGSHQITLWVNGQAVAVDIRQRANQALIHRYLSGPLRFATPDQTDILLWTPEGEQSFSLGAHAKKAASRKEDAPITVEVDERGHVRGIHDLQFDLQISHAPNASSPIQIALKGTVSKLKSSYVFMNTPLGVVTVSKNTGVRNAKVGQEMALWVHDDTVVIDLSQNGTPDASRRFVTSRLTYASQDKTELSLWTPEGEQTFPTNDEKKALSNVREGSPITIEFNHQGGVVGIRRLR